MATKEENMLVRPMMLVEDKESPIGFREETVEKGKASVADELMSVRELKPLKEKLEEELGRELNEQEFEEYVHNRNIEEPRNNLRVKRAIITTTNPLSKRSIEFELENKTIAEIKSAITALYM